MGLTITLSSLKRNNASLETKHRLMDELVEGALMSAPSDPRGLEGMSRDMGLGRCSPQHLSIQTDYPTPRAPGPTPSYHVQPALIVTPGVNKDLRVLGRRQLIM